MRRIFLGSLVIAVFATGGSAFAVDSGSTSGAVGDPSTPPVKQATSAKPKKPPVPLSAAFEAARSTELPTASTQTRQQPSSAQPLWTGTYVGVSGGGGFDSGGGK
jgi:hypothetical protein